MLRPDLELMLDYIIISLFDLSRKKVFPLISKSVLLLRKVSIWWTRVTNEKSVRICKGRFVYWNGESWTSLFSFIKQTFPVHYRITLDFHLKSLAWHEHSLLEQAMVDGKSKGLVGVFNVY
jgi:hypothetical protein